MCDIKIRRQLKHANLSLFKAILIAILCSNKVFKKSTRVKSHLVIRGETVDHNRDGQGEDENTDDGAHAANSFARQRGWTLCSISNYKGIKILPPSINLEYETQIAKKKVFFSPAKLKGASAFTFPFSDKMELCTGCFCVYKSK